VVLCCGASPPFQFVNFLFGWAGDRKRAGALDVLSSGKDGFLLFRRARHVATEAQRVLEFRFVCETEPSISQLPDLGTLFHCVVCVGVVECVLWRSL
jgi:hypothetical protein